MRIQKAPESGQLFEWRNICFEQINPNRYKVTADCVVLEDGADPRDLSNEVLNAAFQVEKGDQAEFTFTTDLSTAFAPSRGDVFEVSADVTIAEVDKEDVILLAKKMVVAIVRALEDLDSACVDIGVDSCTTEDVIRFASLNGLFAGIRSQLDLAYQIFELRLEDN